MLVKVGLHECLFAQLVDRCRVVSCCENPDQLRRPVCGYDFIGEIVAGPVKTQIGSEASQNLGRRV